MTTNQKVSQRIVSIRVANGGSTDRCPTCGHAPAAPYRRIVEGRIVEGCIDATHTDQLPGLSNTATWHNRKEAQAMRAETLKRLTA